MNTEPQLTNPDTHPGVHRYDDPRVATPVLLERCHELSIRDSLSRTSDEAQARMAAAGCPQSDWAPLSVDEHLELLQTRRWIELRMARRQTEVVRAREAGVSWSQIAAVLGIDEDEVRDAFERWIDGQVEFGFMSAAQEDAARAALSITMVVEPLLRAATGA